MRTAIISVIVIYSLFVLVVGNLTQKGMLVAILMLTGLIIMFYRYSNLARNMMRRYDDLKRAVFTADEHTGFIGQLEQRSSSIQSTQPQPGLKVSHAIGILKRAKLRAGYSHTNEPSDDLIRAQEERDTPTQGSSDLTRGS